MTGSLTDRESRPITNVSAVVLNDIGRLVIVQGEQEMLEVEADSQMLPHVQSQVINGTLELGMSRSWSERIANSFTLRHVAYYLTAKKLQRIELKGISNLEMHPFQCEVIEISSRGHVGVKIDSLKAKKLVGKFHWATNVFISGTVELQEISLSGSSKYSAANFSSRQGMFLLTDKSQAEVNVSEKLVIESSDDSYVQYHGNPRVLVNNKDNSSVRSL